MAAKAAGYRSLPAPPTFLFSLELPLDKPLGCFVEAVVAFGPEN
jgi:hypothetical protein